MSNYRGPLEIVVEQNATADGLYTPEPGNPTTGYRLRFFATTNPGEERIEVELRAGRGGVVFVAPVETFAPVEAPALPPNEEMRPVPPEARVTPFSVDDFGPAAEPRPYILWWDQPDENARWFEHPGCIGRGTLWKSDFDLDVLDAPVDTDVLGCPGCNRELKLVPRDAEEDDLDDSETDALLDPEAIARAQAGE